MTQENHKNEYEFEKENSCDYYLRTVSKEMILQSRLIRSFRKAHAFE